MRTEQEMFDLILHTAKENERIRAVYMNGSRTNPHVPKDKYQDYDIVYVVTEIEWFLRNKDWISVFGEPAIVQEPDKNDLADGSSVDISRSYAWLMLFKDGNRIDLQIELLSEGYGRDKLTATLLDKDNILPQIPAPSDADYAVKKPTEARYLSICNNYWWCLQNVSKGIARDQLAYAMNMYIRVVHQDLESMVDWYIGAQTDYSVSVGMWGKYYKSYLPRELYAIYAGTYSDGDYENFWNAIFSACQLFRTIAPVVGAHLGYCYNKQEEDGMMNYLRAMRNELQ
jgi:aminoglycoside 6-adenylyltransferase